MKKLSVIIVALLSVMSLSAAKADLAVELNLSLQSTYLWRGQYLGGLTFLPDVAIGFDTENTSFRAGVCSELSASDWKFTKGTWDADGLYNGTIFLPELDVYGEYDFFGASAYVNFYQYFTPQENAPYDASSHQTEVGVGYSLDHFLGVDLYVNWYTIVEGDDYQYDDNGNTIVDANGKNKQAFSSYLEVGYNYTFEKAGVTLGANVGMSPWTSDNYYNTNFGVVNVSARLEKVWELDKCEITLFGEGSINPNMVAQINAAKAANEPCSYAIYNSNAGQYKTGNQALNGNIGVTFSF